MEVKGPADFRVCGPYNCTTYGDMIWAFRAKGSPKAPGALCPCRDHRPRPQRQGSQGSAAVLQNETWDLGQDGTCWGL